MTDAPYRPFTLYQALEPLASLDNVKSTDIAAAFVASKDVLARLELACNMTVRPPILSIDDPLVSPVNALVDGAVSSVASPEHMRYVRAALAYALMIADNRSVASGYLWVVSHLLAVSQLLTDARTLNAGLPIEANDAMALCSILDRASAYVVAQCARRAPDAWHEDSIAHLRKGASGDDVATGVFLDLVQRSRNTPTSLAVAVLSRFLRLWARSTDMQVVQAERWMALAQSWQKSSKHGKSSPVLTPADMNL